MQETSIFQMRLPSSCRRVCEKNSIGYDIRRSFVTVRASWRGWTERATRRVREMSPGGWRRPRPPGRRQRFVQVHLSIPMVGVTPCQTFSLHRAVLLGGRAYPSPPLVAWRLLVRPLTPVAPTVESTSTRRRATVRPLRVGRMGPLQHVAMSRARSNCYNPTSVRCLVPSTLAVPSS
jgi:hypothetical protein